MEITHYSLPCNIDVAALSLYNPAIMAKKTKRKEEDQSTTPEIPKIFTYKWQGLLSDAAVATVDENITGWLGKEIEAMGKSTVSQQRVDFQKLGPIGQSEIAYFFRSEPADAEIRTADNRVRVILQSDRVENGNGDRRSMEFVWDQNGRPLWLKIRHERITTTPEGAVTVAIRTLSRNHLENPVSRGDIADTREIYTQTAETEPFIQAGPNYIPVRELQHPLSGAEKVFDLPVWSHQFVGVTTGRNGTFEVRHERRVYETDRSPAQFLYENPLQSGPDYHFSLPTALFFNGGQPHDWAHENPVVGETLEYMPLEMELLIPPESKAEISEEQPQKVVVE